MDKAVGATFLVLLIAPALLPAVIAAYSVVGEREQGTLEPLLTTPLRREELLLGKALGVVVPAVGIAYVLFAAIQICRPPLRRQCGRGVSPRAKVPISWRRFSSHHCWRDGRSAWASASRRERATFVSRNSWGRCRAFHRLRWWRLVSFNVFTPSVTLAVVFALILLVADVILFRIVLALFDRERLITGASARRTPGGGGHAPAG